MLEGNRRKRGFALLFGLILVLSACGIPSAPLPSEVRLTPSEITLGVGSTQQLTATVLDQRRREFEIDVAWNSSDAGIASVDENGLVSGFALGSVIITASAGEGLSASTIVTVVPGAPNTVYLTPIQADLAIGGTQPFSAMVTDGSGNPIADAAFTWTSDAGTIAGVDEDGLVSGLMAGSATITASAGEGLSADATVTVHEPTLTLSETSLTLVLGGTASEATRSVTATATPYAGTPMDVTATAGWSSDAAGILDLGTAGVVTALDGGNAAVTVSYQGVTANLAVEVRDDRALDPTHVYIGGSGQADAVRGTLSNPFATITEALTHPEVNLDAVLEIAAGTYFEANTVKLAGHTLRGAGVNQTTIRVAGAEIAIDLAADNATVEGLTVDASALALVDVGTPSPRGIAADGTGGHTIQHVRVVGTVTTTVVQAEARNLAGIWLFGSQGTTVSDVIVEDTQRSGVHVQGGGNITLTDITLRNTAQPGAGSTAFPGPGALGVYADGTSGPLQGLLLSGNWQIEAAAGRHWGIAVDAQVGTVQLDVGPSFNWLSDAPAQIGVFSPLNRLQPNDPQGLYSALGVNHLAVAPFGDLFDTDPDGGPATLVGYADQAAALTGARSLSDLDPLVIELEPGATGFRNLLVFHLDESTEGSIQSAVDTVALANAAGVPALSFSQGVLVTAGTYHQQVEITTSGVVLQGEGTGATYLAMPIASSVLSDGFNSRIHVTGDINDVVLRDFTVQGPFQTVGGVRRTNGISFVRGAEASIHSVAVLEVRTPTGTASQELNGVLVGHSGAGLGGATLAIEGLRIEMGASSKRGLVVTHEDAVVTGTGLTIVAQENGSPNPAQNGLQVEFSTVDLSDVDIRGFSYDSPSTSASAVLTWDALALTIQGGTVADSDNGVVIAGSENDGAIELSGIAFEGNARHLGYLVPGLDVFIGHNTFDGIDPATASPEELVEIEDKIQHAVDNASLGRFLLTE